MRKQEHVWPITTFILIAVIAIAARYLSGCEMPNTVIPPAPSATPSQRPDSCCALAWGLKDGPTHRPVKATGYTPENTAMEGGPQDRYGKPLQTLQQFLSGKSQYVSAAMDEKLGAVKRKICSPELNAAFGKALKLYVVDTGQAFTGRGWARIDVANDNQAGAQSPKLNRSDLSLIECQ